MKSEEIENKKRYSVIENETGEIVTQQDKVYWRTEKQDKAWREIQNKKTCDAFFRDYQVNELGGFVFMQYNNLTTLTEQYGIPLQDIPKLVYLSSFLSYKTNILKTDDNEFMTKKSMASVLNVSRNIFNKFYNLMIEKNILIEQDKKILINSNIITKGEVITDKYKTKVYITSIRYLYENTHPKKHKYLGFIYQIMPYVNKYNCGICRNPFEEDFKLVEPMTTRELCEILGVSMDGKNSKNITRTKKLLNSIKLKDGTNIVVSVKINGKREDLWLVNPKVISNHVSYHDFKIISAFFFSDSDSEFNSLEENETIDRNNCIVFVNDEGEPLLIRNQDTMEVDEEGSKIYVDVI